MKKPKAHSHTITTADYDSPWKEAIRLHFESFLQFFFPRIWADIDWTQGYEMLDKKLQKIVRSAALGHREVDALVRVTRRSGAEKWVLIHIEVQSQVDRNFGFRMALYHSRIRDRYNRDVCSLANLGDEDPRWRPRSFVSELWGCRQKLWFPVKKLLDFPKTARKPHNPFSWLVAAHRQAQATKSDPMARKAIKFRMVRGLICDSGLTREEVGDFFRLVDWVLALPKEIEYAFEEDLASFERERHMVHITSIERIQRERAIAEGVRQSILQVVDTRWGLVDADLNVLLEAIGDANRLAELHKAALTADSPEQWKEQLAPGP